MLFSNLSYNKNFVKRVTDARAVYEWNYHVAQSGRLRQAMRKLNSLRYIRMKSAIIKRSPSGSDRDTPIESRASPLSRRTPQRLELDLPECWRNPESLARRRCNRDGAPR